MIYLADLDSQQYDLSQLAQSIFTTYYLTPFPPKSSLTKRDPAVKHFEIKDPRIPRVTHGAMHAARVAAYVKITHVFRQDHDDSAISDLVEVIHGYDLSMTQIIHLTQMAALFHDVSREDEGFDYWDEESANECLNFLQTEVGSLPDCIMRVIANTIHYKDNHEGFLSAAMSLGLTHREARAFSYLRELIHDADCLDIMRVRKTFKIHFLEMFNSPGLQHVTGEIVDLVKEVRSLISQQGDQYFDCVVKIKDDTIDENKSNFNPDLKFEYEWDENVYKKITHDMKDYATLSGIERLLKKAYPFNPPLLAEINQAFMSALIVSEPVEFSCPDSRDYLFIKFQQPIMTSFKNPEQPGHDDVIAILFDEDVDFTKHCNQLLKPLNSSVDLGFRFCGVCNTQKSVEISGFSLKITYNGNKFSLRESLFDILFRALEHNHLMKRMTGFKERMLSILSSQIEQPRRALFTTSGFFKPTKTPISDSSQLEAVAAYIMEHIPPISAKYIRENELGMNPTYQTMDVIDRPLEMNRKKIWVLRSDLILAVGNKNANWIKFNDTDLPDAIDTELHAHVNWDDRYGHTSLAIPHPGYDGSVLYGGYLAQRDGYMEIYTFSGRYYRQDLDDHRKAVLEAYVAHHVQKAYGNQPVVFIDAVEAGPNAVLDNFELSIYLHNHSLPEYCIRRSYTQDIIQSVFDRIEPHSTVECIR
ncbi:MAG TPA: hypothetical protein DDY37_03230 [Legionella sp.]|nr:hypothetical protein [Legionella sp.]